MCPDDRWLTFLLPVDNSFPANISFVLGLGLSFLFSQWYVQHPSFNIQKSRNIADNVKCVADEKIL